MCRYKHSLRKIETSYIVPFSNGSITANLQTTNSENLDTILLFLSSFGQFFVSGPKGS